MVKSMVFTRLSGVIPGLLVHFVNKHSYSFALLGLKELLFSFELIH